MKRAIIAGVIALGVVLWVFVLFVHRAPKDARETSDAAPLRELHVPRVDAEPKIDGDLDEPAWRGATREIFTGADGSQARPYADARLAWTDGVLLVGLYASDHDIVTGHVAADGPVWRGDDFHVVFTRAEKSFSFDVDPKCTLTDGTRSHRGASDYSWQSGARLACDADGTIDTPGDNDEEWVVEMAIPLSALDLEGKSGERVELTVRRCDLGETGGKPLETPCPRIAPIEIVLD